MNLNLFAEMLEPRTVTAMLWVLIIGFLLIVFSLVVLAFIKASKKEKGLKKKSFRIGKEAGVDINKEFIRTADDEEKIITAQTEARCKEIEAQSKADKAMAKTVQDIKKNNPLDDVIYRRNPDGSAEISSKMNSTVKEIPQSPYQQLSLFPSSDSDRKAS